MVKKILLSVTLVSVLFSSCKKDDVKPDSTNDSGTTTQSKKTVQQRLQGGESPVSIYKSDSTLLDSLYGKSYAGGLIIYLDMKDSSGIVAAANNQSSSAQWGCNSFLIAEQICSTPTNCFTRTLASGSTIGSGKDNTGAIVFKCSGSSAAKICQNLSLNGFTDWYLPSRFTGAVMLDKLKLTGLYWTSTQSSRDRAYSVSKSGTSPATSGTRPKSTWRAVRAVRQFKN